MPKQLRLEEMLDCLRILGERDMVQNITRTLEEVGTRMAFTIARRLNVRYGPAVCEGSEFEGCCAPFWPSYLGQPCPEPLSDFDKAEWGEPDSPLTETLGAKAEFECPECGSHHVAVKVEAALVFSEDGSMTVDAPSTSYDSDSWCICQKCSHESYLKWFYA